LPSIGRKAPRVRVPVSEHAGGLVLPRLLRRPLRRSMRFLREGRLFSPRLLLLTLLPVACCAGVIALHQSGLSELVLARASIMAGFRIGDVEVHGGREVSKIDVLANFDLGPERPLFTFDVHEARERLRALPWVSDARVTKSYPDRLAVAVIEHEPFAIWQRSDRLRLVGRGGNVIAPFEERFAGLPLVVGAGANEVAAQIVSLVARYRPLAQRTRAFVRVGGRRWNLVLENGVTVLLPAEDVEAALRELTALQERFAIFERDILSVDLRVANRLVLGLSDAAVESIQRLESDRMQLARSGKGAL
jgi:cell division protein FtsQ